MTIKSVQPVAVFFLLALAASAFCSTSEEVFNQAHRSYELGKYIEADEVFTRFLQGWPDHENADKARYLRLISRSRTIESRIEKDVKNVHQSLEQEYSALNKKFSDKELAEARLAVEYVQNGAKPYSWALLSNIPEEQLNIVLARGWHPEPGTQPIKVLEFVQSAERNNKNHSNSQLAARIQYLKALALWQLVLSPLAAEANSDIIKAWNDWPVHNALDKALRIGFNLGNSDIKKKVALLGLHFDCFRHKEALHGRLAGSLKSRWFSYLSDRGINLQEAWCPR